ncbi:hypothetical protein DES38_10946 [Streptohalobacillus salinus]|uniref:Uncharacterized protein n=1 Tax=Streptohalobacillus salinus TaxID=621096 RepID=A0A2V3W702_9BACI|nr:hypothetical protein DES38_10946 [Streptohalobacillus salinus]
MKLTIIEKISLAILVITLVIFVYNLITNRDLISLGFTAMVTYGILRIINKNM